MPSINVHSQESGGYSIGVQSHYGFIISHSEKIEPVSHTKPYGFDISVSRLHTKYDSWKVFRKYNSPGIQFSYFNFQNPDITGCAYLLTVFTEPVIKSGNKYMLSVRAGGGFSYQTKIFNYDTDSLNRFFSTRISFPLYISLRAKYSLSPQMFLTLSGTYNHISNGAIKVPNLGMNFPTADLGLQYYFSPVPDISKSPGLERNTRKFATYINFQALTGFRWVWGEFTWTTGASARITRQIRTFYAVNAGAELILDGGIRRMIAIEEKSCDYKRFAVTAGHNFFLGKITFSQNIGIYLYSPYKAKRPYYEKYELSYDIMRGVSAGVFLKSHAIDAEVLGFAINYLLPFGTRN
jgi:hypothetical protein